jgi:two-component system, chemotaxis family, response regulator Rcp1
LINANLSRQPVEILLVEDSPSDVCLTQEGLKNARVRNRLSVVSDGEQAISFLERKQPFEQAPRPHLILLDLNLPKLNGREVLARIRKDPSLKHIPVVILTTSEAESDILASYELQANSYVTKPVGFEQFMHTIKTIESYWLELVKLPGGPLHD